MRVSVYRSFGVTTLFVQLVTIIGNCVMMGFVFIIAENTGAVTLRNKKKYTHFTSQTHPFRLLWYKLVGLGNISLFLNPMELDSTQLVFVAFE